MKSPRSLLGFSLLEALTTLAVLGVLLAVAMPNLERWLLRHRHRAQLESLQNDLQWTRQLALTSQEAIHWRVQHLPTGSCYVIHTGAPQACQCTVGGAPQCAGEAVALKAHELPASMRLRLAASANTLRFDPRYATVTPTATLSVTAPDGERGDQVVALTGRVRTCVTHRQLYPAPACLA